MTIGEEHMWLFSCLRDILFPKGAVSGMLVTLRYSLYAFVLFNISFKKAGFKDRHKYIHTPNPISIFYLKMHLCLL